MELRERWCARACLSLLSWFGMQGGGEWLGHRASLFNSGGAAKLFSMFCTLINTNFPFFFNHSHPSGCAVGPHYGFGLHFPSDEQYWEYFQVPVGHLHTFFGEMPIQASAHFQNWVVCLSVVEV